jgi:hypothetical protein
VESQRVAATAALTFTSGTQHSRLPTMNSHTPAASVYFPDTAGRK